MSEPARDTASDAPADPVPGTAPEPAFTATTLLLLRHGETRLTAERRFSGSGGEDPALSERGRWQAERAAAAVAARGDVSAVVSSPLARCRETAAAVAAALDVEVTVVDGLRETAFGTWDGLTFADVRSRFPAEMAAWLASPAVAPPGGESLVDVGTRVARTRDELLARHHGRTVLLVSHLTPINTVVRLALGAPEQALFRMHLDPASLSEVAHYADGNASLRSFNDTAHLRG